MKVPQPPGHEEKLPQLGTSVDPSQSSSIEDPAVQATISKELGEITPAVQKVMAETEANTLALKQWLSDLETRFSDPALSKLHEGISWMDVKRSLEADPKSMERLMAFDAKGHLMNVLCEENGEYVFVSAWDNYENVSLDHRKICYDSEGEKVAQHRKWNPRGNALAIIAGLIGVSEEEAVNYLATTEYHRKLMEPIYDERDVRGIAWLKADPERRRETHKAPCGLVYGRFEFEYASSCNDTRAFRASLRVKKA